jgi:hypothetical protein
MNDGHAKGYVHYRISNMKHAMIEWVTQFSELEEVWNAFKLAASADDGDAVPQNLDIMSTVPESIPQIVDLCRDAFDAAKRDEDEDGPNPTAIRIETEACFLHVSYEVEGVSVGFSGYMDRAPWTLQISGKLHLWGKVNLRAKAAGALDVTSEEDLAPVKGWRGVPRSIESRAKTFGLKRGE